MGTREIDAIMFGGDVTVTLTGRERNDLIQPINALRLLLELNALDKNIFPGADGILDRAHKVLKEHKGLIPSWYKEKIT